MIFRNLFLCCLLVVLTCTAPVMPAAEPELVAGKSVEDYAALINDPNRVVRLRAVKSLGAFGAAAAKSLGQALDHDDKAMKYSAAVALGRIGGPMLQDCKPKLQVFLKDKESLALRMAAAYALCCAGEVDENLKVLEEGLAYPERGMACSAAELLGGLGKVAAPALNALEVVHAKNRPGLKGGDYHLGGAAMNAIRKIKGE